MSLVRLVWVAHHARQAHARFVEVRLRTGEGNAVVGDVNEQSVVPLPGFLQDFNETQQPFVCPLHGHVVLRQFLAAFGRVRQVVRHNHVCRINGFGTFAHKGTMRFRGAEIQEERTISLRWDCEVACLIVGKNHGRSDQERSLF